MKKSLFEDDFSQKKPQPSGNSFWVLQWEISAGCILKITAPTTPLLQSSVLRCRLKQPLYRGLLLVSTSTFICRTVNPSYLIYLCLCTQHLTKYVWVYKYEPITDVRSLPLWNIIQVDFDSLSDTVLQFVFEKIFFLKKGLLILRISTFSSYAFRKFLLSKSSWTQNFHQLFSFQKILPV